MNGMNKWINEWMMINKWWYEWWWMMNDEWMNE